MNDEGIGAPAARVDAREKVTGRAVYSADVARPGLAHAALVRSPVARGKIRSFELDEARALPGVLLVLTHENMRGEVKKIAHFMNGGTAATTLVPLDSPEIHHAGQLIALVVADTFETAREAALRVRVVIEEWPSAATFDSEGVVVEEVETGRAKVGDARRVFEASKITVDAEYETPTQHHNPIELFATTCEWSAGKLTVWEPSQFVYGLQNGLAKQLGMHAADVRVFSRFIGGAFGSKAQVTPRTALVAIAARMLDRPVKLVATRTDGFHVSTYRGETRHRVRLAAERDGAFRALIHEGFEIGSRVDTYAASGTEVTARLYDCPNVDTNVRIVHADRATPGFMRAPAEMPYVFALECAVDELAVALAMDPIELRRRNDTQVEPIHQIRWSSRSLMPCFDAAAAAFGWSKRDPRPGSMRDGDWLVGWGAATAIYPTYMAPAAAEIVIHDDGHAAVRTAAHEIGTGITTILAQTAASKLGLPLARVDVELGDSDLPVAPVAGGSNSTASLCGVVSDACDALRARLAKLAVKARDGALHGADADALRFAGGALVAPDGRREALDVIVRRSGDADVRALAKSNPKGTLPFGTWLEAKGMPLVASGTSRKDYVAAAFGAELVEVRVHRRTCEIRVPRMVGAFAAGRIMNPRTARSQLLGGMIWGIGSALHEATEMDLRTSRYVNDDLADYLVPVNADAPQVEALLIPEHDEHVNPLGIKGLGELGVVGTAAAIANAVFHATGKRLRRLPIRPEDLL